jgi:hypothetical protein
VVGGDLGDAAGDQAALEQRGEALLNETALEVPLLRPGIREVDPETGDARVGDGVAQDLLCRRLHQAHVAKLGPSQAARHLQHALERVLDAYECRPRLPRRQSHQKLAASEPDLDDQG